MNVSGTETENEIAGSEHVADVAMHAHKTRLISHSAMTVRQYGIGDGLTADSGNRRLARRINIGDDDAIGLIKGGAKLIAQRLGARVAMWLKHCQHPLASGRTRCRQGGADFRGMMRVIVDQQKAVASVLDFETAAGVPKFGQGNGDLFERHAKLARQRNHDGGVLHIVPARNAQTRLAQLSALMKYRKN